MSSNNIRTGCELHGAARTVSAIGGLIPVIHSNAGCTMQSELSDSASGLYPLCGGSALPSTSVIERHVVFGGASRLREQLKNTLKVVDGKVYIILSGCEAAMVGDDAGAMAKEAVQQGGRVFSCDTAGFRGGAHRGYKRVMHDIIRNLPLINGVADTPADDKNKLTVNIFGLPPVTDVFFHGALDELKRLLAGIGVRANIFFGPNGFDELAAAPAASLSIVLSKWGLKAAEELKLQYCVPVLEIEGVPVGYAQTATFLEKVAQVLGVAQEATTDFLSREQSWLESFLQIAEGAFYRLGGKSRIAVVADTAWADSVANFAKDYLGVKDALKIYTDDENGGGNIAEQIRDFGAEAIIGSSSETEIADELGVPLIQASYPLSGHVVLGKHYAGITGALRLAEDYFSAAAQSEIEAQKQRLTRIKAYSSTLILIIIFTVCVYCLRNCC